MPEVWIDGLPAIWLSGELDSWSSGSPASRRSSSSSSACTSSEVRRMARRPRPSSSGKERVGRLAIDHLLCHLLVGLRPIELRVHLNQRLPVVRGLGEADRLLDDLVEELDSLALAHLLEV